MKSVKKTSKKMSVSDGICNEF